MSSRVRTALLLLFAATTAGAQSSRALQDSLDAARRQRQALEAAINRQLAAGIADRASKLSMTTETGALQKLEQLLDSAQSQLLEQRDRLRSLRDAVTQTNRAVVVVLFKAQSIPDGEMAAVVVLDGDQQAPVTIPAARARSLLSGGAEELYRGEAAPGDHKVTVTFAAKGITASESVTLPASAREIRYIEFAYRNGILVPTTWSLRANPF